MLLCKAKQQYLFMCKVSRYCFLALCGRTVVYGLFCGVRLEIDKLLLSVSLLGTTTLDSKCLCQFVCVISGREDKRMLRRVRSVSVVT